MKKITNPGLQWKEALQDGGYEHHVSSDLWRRLRRFSRLWRRILRVIKIEKEGKGVFEVGCGGGIHLAQFALNGYQCAGIDVSPEVLDRAKNFFSEIHSATGNPLAVELIGGDFLTYNLDKHLNRYDLVFHVGVIEHFLDQGARALFLERMFFVCRPGGFVISIVPSGMHPWRSMMKQHHLGGYNIPEIDYTEEVMVSEFRALGAKEIIVLPHNIFSYLLIKKNLVFKIMFYVMQFVPAKLFPKEFAFRHSGSLIGIAKKP